MNQYFTNYFNPVRPICSEEKQYTLFLYNKLLSLMEKQAFDESDYALLKACGISGKKIKILSAAYEATYMRDIFTQEKYDRNGENQIDLCIKPSDGHPSFNEMLFSFVNRTFQVPMEHVYLNRNFGKGKVFKIAAPEEKQPQQMIDTLKGMMNEKPAIALLYQNGRKKYFKLLDCKYLSGESMNNGISQARLYEMIAEFLCERIHSETGKNYQPESGVVYFISEKNENWKAIAASPDHCIRLQDLIPNVLQ